MSRKRFIALGAAAPATALALACIGPASGAGASAGRPTVSVRVEGLTHTLLAPSTVTTKTGWITRFGAPTGKCPATSAAGALDLATKHRWVATFDKSFGDYEITSILGEAHSFTSKDFWEIFVDDVAASKGSCEIGLHSGEQLLFAAVPDSTNEYPLAVSAPANATAGSSFTVKVVWFKGHTTKPLAGARVTGTGVNAVTDRRGVATITGAQAGTLVLRAAAKGYIRAAPVTVHVS